MLHLNRRRKTRDPRVFAAATRPIGFALAAVALALLAAGCGQAIPSSQGGAASLTADNSEYGKYLTDQQGHSLYLFEADEHNDSHCYGACASVWPPYLTDSQPTAGPGVSQKLVGTIQRDDGTTQVTYAGEPLYYYAGDASDPASDKGEGIQQFGALWYFVSPKNGEPDSSSGGAS